MSSMHLANMDFREMLLTNQVPKCSNIVLNLSIKQEIYGSRFEQNVFAQQNVFKNHEHLLVQLYIPTTQFHCKCMY